MTDLTQIKSLLETLEKDASLADPKNFDERAAALEFIEFHLLDALQALPQTESIQLKPRIENLHASLKEIDERLFKRLRAGVISGQCRGKVFEDLIGEYFDLVEMNSLEEGYDNLDVFINRLFGIDRMPEQTKELSPEMVFYQKTPARVVFEIAREAGFTKNDVFFDIGSGLGHVSMLINLLAGIPAHGIEYEPAFCEFANGCAAGLNLPEITFINTDAREADYTRGTVLFMYTPFKGRMLQQVLARLREQAAWRRIKIITYGPCTAEIKQESWLQTTSAFDGNKPAIFESILA